MRTIRRLSVIAAMLGSAALLAGAATPAPKKGFVADIEALTEANTDFRRVLYTGKNLQLVLMAIAPGEDIGEEVHSGVDQFFRVESGEGEFRIDGVTRRVKADDAFIVPAGASHNVVNKGKGPLKLYTIYAPPEHRDGIVRATKAEAQVVLERYRAADLECEGHLCPASGIRSHLGYASLSNSRVLRRDRCVSASIVLLVLGITGL